MDVPAGTATIDVTTGNHAITAPLVLSKNTRVTVAQAGDTLTISNLQPTAATLTKAGAGTLVVNNVRSPSITIEGGTVKVAANGGDSGTSRVGVVAASGGRVDLVNNQMIVTADIVGSWNGSNYSGVTGQVRAGRNGAAWNGNGIITSASDASSSNLLKTLAVAKAGDLGKTSFGGVSVIASDVLVMYTFAGDANLSGTIDGDDFFAIDGGYSTRNNVSPLLGFSNGDFDYNGVVNVDDYWLIDRSYGRQNLSPGGVVSVPEPAAATVFAAALMVAARRRRRM
jgi:hypothetical protein